MPDKQTVSAVQCGVFVHSDRPTFFNSSLCEGAVMR